MGIKRKKPAKKKGVRAGEQKRDYEVEKTLAYDTGVAIRRKRT